MTVSVPVTKAFVFEGRTVHIGEMLVVSPVMAAALHRRGVVSLEKPSTPLLTRDLAADESVEKPVTRRRYRRRDLVAES